MWRIVLNFQAWLERKCNYFRVFYFNGNEISISMKPVTGSCRNPYFSLCLPLCFFFIFLFFWNYRCSSQLHIAMLPCLLPVPGSVPRLSVSALRQGMNNTAPRLLAGPKWGARTSGSKPFTSAAGRAPVKTGNYSPVAAAMAIPLLGASKHEVEKNLNRECAQQARENPVIS